MQRGDYFQSPVALLQLAVAEVISGQLLPQEASWQYHLHLQPVFQGIHGDHQKSKALKHETKGTRCRNVKANHNQKVQWIDQLTIILNLF